LLVEFAQVAWLLVQNQWPIADSANLLHKVPDFLKHLAQFAIAALNQHHFVPGVVALPHLANPRRRCAHLARPRFALLDGHARAQNIQLAFGWNSGHLYQVSLLHSDRCLGQLVG
jgi:hypothetical protein